MVSTSPSGDATEADISLVAPSAHLKCLSLSLISWNVAGLRGELDDPSCFALLKPMTFCVFRRLGLQTQASLFLAIFNIYLLPLVPCMVVQKGAS